MPNPNFTFDHMHLISKNPAAAVQWYVDKLAGEIVRCGEVRGAPQLCVIIGGGSMLIARGERPGETTGDKVALAWGVDQFGVPRRRFCRILRRAQNQRRGGQREAPRQRPHHTVCG